MIADGKTSVAEVKATKPSASPAAPRNVLTSVHHVNVNQLNELSLRIGGQFEILQSEIKRLRGDVASDLSNV
ncbi:MAG: hypothetical protein ACKO96_06050, partial [Flammeovirgaceae bacterium]